MAVYKSDIVDVELESGNIYRSFLKNSIGSGDSNANRFGVRVFRNGQAEDLTGVSCQAVFVNAEDTRIALTSYGTVSGNTAYVTLPQACYNVEGKFCLSIKLIGGSVTGTMRIVDGMVNNTGTNGAVAPTGSIPTYQQVLALYEDVLDLAETAMINRGIGRSPCDSLTTDGIYFCSSSGDVKSIEGYPFQYGWLIVTTTSNHTMQYAIEWAENPKMVVRIRMSGVWQEWNDAGGNPFAVSGDNIKATANQISANNLTTGGVYFSSSYNNTPGITDAPYGIFWLIVSPVAGTNMCIQIAWPYYAQDNPFYRVRSADGTWGTWKGFGGGGGSGTTINNTYNITCSPQFTTDTNGWLQAVDTDTSSETGKTDMTGAIMAMLNSVGYCHLGPGIFYVSGNIDMPNGSMLEGCGINTTIRLLQSVTTGYVVKVTKANTVRNLTISGAYTASIQSSGTLGTRNGIICIANADGQESSMPTVSHNMVDNCTVFGFSGSAIYQHNTGGGVDGAITVSNTTIRRCGAGINVDYYSEYNKYSNIVTDECYYACINNGGNNVFTGCTFWGTIGFLMDNTNGDLRNPAHGSCVGCTFNHIDSWNHQAQSGGGDAVKVINNAHGFIFDGCQFWYSAIKINGSRGMTFSNCLFGGESPAIKVEGTYGAFFHGCTFQDTPSLDVNSATKFDGCYKAADSSVIEQ